MHRLLLLLLDFLLQLQVGLPTFVIADVVDSLGNALVKVAFEQVIVHFELKVLRQQLIVNFSRQRHEANSFLVYFRNQRFPWVLIIFGIIPGLILRRDQVRDEEFSELRSQYLTLTVKDWGQVIVILLMGESDFNQVTAPVSVREIKVGVRLDAPNCFKQLFVFGWRESEQIVQNALYYLIGFYVLDGFASVQKQDVVNVWQSPIDVLKYPLD